MSTTTIITTTRKKTIRLDDLIEILILGGIGTVILTIFGSFVYLMYSHPRLLILMMILFVVDFIIGWCMKNYDNFKDVFGIADTSLRGDSDSRTEYRIPLIGKLQQFEKKHRMSTVEFMIFVHDGNIPFGMDNLDYLEWLSLVNELPTIMHGTEKGK